MKMKTAKRISSGKEYPMSSRVLAPVLSLSLPRGVTLARVVAVWRERRALARLDDARLADLGLTREEAMREARRPFWDLPA
jgi:uncharacterized protein YjiS (DUF1127 family)